MTHKEIFNLYKKESEIRDQQWYYLDEDSALKAMAEAVALKEELKICTGCGTYNDKSLGLNKNGEPYLACCPDSHYVPVKEYIAAKDKEIAELKNIISNSFKEFNKPFQP